MATPRRRRRRREPRLRRFARPWARSSTAADEVGTSGNGDAPATNGRGHDEPTTPEPVATASRDAAPTSGLRPDHHRPAPQPAATIPAMDTRPADGADDGDEDRWEDLFGSRAFAAAD
jgi:hypothetical protein